MTRWMIPVAAVAVLAIAAKMIYAAVAGDVVKAPSTTQPADHLGPLTYTMNDIDGQPIDLSQYKGKVVMIVNVASRCGFTPQYTGLEALYNQYKDKGFIILGFPANNFHGQEPGTDEEIKTFCTAKYNVTFPIFSKISVKGDDKAPLYKFLTEPATNGDFAGDITWNFNKFLVDRNGQVYARFASPTKPQDKKVTDAIEAALGQ